LDDTPTDADSAVATNPRLAAWRRLLGPASLALALTVSSTLVALELRAPAPLAASSPTITLTPPATRETATLPALTAEAPPALAAATPPAPVAAASAARPAPAPAEPRFVRVHVRGQSGARALLDDAAVGVLPLDLEVPAVAHPRRLVVIAAGHRFAQEVPGDVDSFVLVEAVPSSNDSNSQAIAARAGIRKNRFAR